MQSEQVLIIAQFATTLDDACEALQHAKIDYDFDTDHWDLQTISELLDRQDRRRVAILAESLPNSDPEEQWDLPDDNLPTMSIVVLERHPLQHADDRIVRFAKCLPCRSHLQFLVSLDDPLMRRFLGDTAHGLLQKLGMGEDEAIESRLVTRHIVSAQQKIEQYSYGNSKAESPEEWFDLNYPANW